MNLHRYRLVRPFLALPELWGVLLLVSILKILQGIVPPGYSASLGWTIHPYQVFAVCVALAYFILPGALLTRILGIGGSWLTRLPSYVAAAVGVWSIPILWVASSEKYNIEYLMRLGFILVALMAVAAYLRELWRPTHPDDALDQGRTDLDEPLNPVLAYLTFAVLLAAIYLSFNAPVALDDNLQLMYVQDDLAVPRINEFEPVFGAGIRPQTRGSLTTWPLSLTIIAKMTGLPAQQAFWLLRTPLVLLNLLAVYALSLRMFGRRNLALLSILFYFFLTLIYTTDADAIGFALYSRNAQDKFVARYTMFPMALAWSLAYLKKPEYRAYWMAGLSTIGLSATHPIGVILLGIPLGGLGLIHLFNHLHFQKPGTGFRHFIRWPIDSVKQNWPAIGSLARLSMWSFIAVILPLLQKASPDAPIVAYSLTDTRDPTLWFRVGLVLNSHRLYIADYLGPGAYIVHPSVFLEAYIIIPLLCLPLFLLLKKKRWEEELISGAFLLNPALLLIPPVIQFIGSRATPWLLYRFAWPISLLGPLAIVWASYSLLDVLRRSFPNNRFHSVLPALIMIIAAIVFNGEIKRGLTILNEQRTDSFSSRCRTLQPLFSKLPDLVGKGTVILSTPDNNLCMVSSAAYAYPVEFGLTTTINRFPASRVDEAIQRMNDVLTFSFAEVVDQDFMDILTRWNVGLILLRADHSLVSTLQHMPQFFELVLTEDRYVVYRVIPGTGIDIQQETPSKDRWKVVHWQGDDALVTANTLWSQEHWDESLAIYETLARQNGDIGLLGLLGMGRANLSAGRLDEAIDALEEATEKYPYSIQAWLLYGSTSMIKSDYTRMELAYQRVLEQLAWHPEALFRLADAYRFQGEADQAAIYYQRAVATDATPGTSIYYRSLGSTYIKINWNKEAIAALDSSLKIRESLLAYSLLSQIYLNMNDLERAEDIAHRAKKLDYWSDVHNLIVGKIELHQLNYDDAIEYFRNAIASNPESNAIDHLSSTLSEVHGDEVALEEVSNLIGYKLGFAKPILAGAQIQYSLGRLGDAIASGERALEWKPVESRAADLLGNAQVSAGNWDQAHHYFTTALTLNPFDHGAYVGLIALAQMTGENGTALGWGWDSIVTSPYNPDTRIMEGTILEINGETENAFDSFLLATMIGPSNPQTYVTIGDFHLRLGQYDSAIHYYNTAIELQPDTTSAYRGLYDANQSLGEYPESLKQINNALQMHPAEGANLVRAAEVLMQAGDYEGAQNKLLQSIRLDPGYREAFASLGGLYTSLGRTSEAEAIYLQLLQSMPLYEDGYVRLGKFYESQGDSAKAFAIYQSGLKQVSPHQSAQVILAEADLLRRKGKFDQALELYQRSISREPMSVSGYLALSDFYINRGDLALAKKTLDRGLALMPNEHDLNLTLMRLQILQGKIDLAENTYDQLISVTPSPEASIVHAQLTASMGQPDLAVAEIKADLQRWPGNVDILRSGVALAIAAGQLDEARSMATELIAVAPGYASSWIALGEMYTARAEFDLAELAFYKATEVEPGSPAGSIALGTFLDARGQGDRAVQSLKTAVKADHSSVAPHLVLARVLTRLGNTNEAMNEYKVAADLDASQNSALLAIGQIRQNEGKLSESNRYFLKAIEISPLDAEAYYAQSQTYLLQGKVDAARQLLTIATHKSTGSCHAFLNLANFLAAQGEYSDARNAYEQTLRRSGCRVDAHLGLGSLYQIQAQPELALDEFLHAIDSGPGNAAGYVATAWSYTQQARPLDAESTYKNGIATVPASTLIRIAYIRNMIQNGRLSEGLDAAQDTVQIIPNTASYLVLGEAYQSLGQYEEAKQSYVESSLADRSEFMPFLRLGNLYAKLTQFSQAETEYRHAIKLVPTDPQGYISLGNLLLARGRTDEGIQILEQSLKTNQGQNSALIAQTRYYMRVGNFDNAGRSLLRAFAIPASNAVQFNNDDVLMMANDVETGSITAWIVMGDLYRLQGNWAEAEKAYQQAINNAPGSINSYISLGKAYQAQGLYPEAREQFDRAIELAPGVGLSHIALADLFNIQADFQEAEQTYKQTIAISPGQSDALIHLGDLYLSQGKSVEAKEQYEKAILVAPTVSTSWVALGDWFLAEADVEQAQKAYQSAIIMSPDDPTGYIARGNYFQNRGQRDKALAQYQEALKIAPISKLPYLAIAGWYQIEADWVNAENWYNQAIKMDSEDISGLLGIGYIKLAQGRPRDALLSFQAAQDRIPANHRTFVALGDWYWTNVNVEASKAAANKELSNALGLLPEGERGQEPDEFIEYLFYGVQDMKDDEVPDAYENFEAAVAADPTSVLPYLAMGEWYRMGVGFLDAEESYQSAIALTPSDVDSYLHLGNLYLITNRREEAFEQFEKAAELAPGLAAPHLYLAGWYQLQGKIPEAESEYLAAIKVNPGELRSYLGLAKIYELQEKYAAATAQYEIATSIGLPFEISVCGPGRLPSSPLGSETTEIYSSNFLSLSSWQCEWDQRPWSSLEVIEPN